MIEVFHLDAKTLSHNEIFTRFVIVGRILSIHSFKSLCYRVVELCKILYGTSGHTDLKDAK